MCMGEAGGLHAWCRVCGAAQQRVWQQLAGPGQGEVGTGTGAVRMLQGRQASRVQGASCRPPPRCQ